jgi:outer membrane biosynthesis protein TonB
MKFHLSTVKTQLIDNEEKELYRDREGKVELSNRVRHPVSGLSISFCFFRKHLGPPVTLPHFFALSFPRSSLFPTPLAGSVHSHLYFFPLLSNSAILIAPAYPYQDNHLLYSYFHEKPLTRKEVSLTKRTLVEGEGKELGGREQEEKEAKEKKEKKEKREKEKKEQKEKEKEKEREWEKKQEREREKEKKKEEKRREEKKREKEEKEKREKEKHEKQEKEKSEKTEKTEKEGGKTIIESSRVVIE